MLLLWNGDWEFVTARDDSTTRWCVQDWCLRPNVWFVSHHKHSTCLYIHLLSLMEQSLSWPATSNTPRSVDLRWLDMEKAHRIRVLQSQTSSCGYMYRILFSILWAKCFTYSVQVPSSSNPGLISIGRGIHNEQDIVAGAQGYVHAARAALCSPSVALLHDGAIVGDDVLWAFKAMHVWSGTLTWKELAPSAWTRCSCLPWGWLLTFLEGNSSGSLLPMPTTPIVVLTLFF